MQSIDKKEAKQRESKGQIRRKKGGTKGFKTVQKEDKTVAKTKAKGGKT